VAQDRNVQSPLPHRRQIELGLFEHVDLDEREVFSNIEVSARPISNRPASRY
jgi:hypothetical protein